MDIIDFGRYFGALLLVIGLVGFAAYGARRFKLPGFIKPLGKRRLEIVESLSISPRQRLVLIRRDGVEHLVAFSDGGASLIESNIAKPDDAAEVAA